MAIFREITENERIIEGMRDIHPLLDYDVSEVYALDLIEVGLSALYGFSVRA